MTTETEQTTTTTEAPNSDLSTTTTEETNQSNTSTTEASTEDKIDLSATGEEKTEETSEDKGEEKTEETSELFGAPAEGESYTIEGLPEGMAIDEDALAAADPIFRELNLSNAAASKLAQTYATAILPKVQGQILNGVNQDVVATRAEWEGAARDAIAGKGEPLKNAAGETITFDGKDIKGVQATAAKALDKLAPEGFRAWLDETGLSVHPMMVAFAYNAGKTVGEETELEPVDTTDPKPGSKSTVKSGGMHKDRFYNR